MTYVSLRARSAELRMRAAYAALEAAELAVATPIKLERLERACLQATAAYDAARSLSERTTRAGEAASRTAGGRPAAARWRPRGPGRCDSP